jgi:hypothetical protein
VPQGAILSPTLYNILTATFADDTAIFASLLVQNQLQDQLNEISDSKTQAIFFYRCTKNVPQTEITLNGDSIPWSEEVKYLGLH